MTAQPLFGLASDLHMDFAGMNREFFEWRGDVLLLAGDLAEDDNLRKMHEFWTRVADMAEEVYTVAGNHEFYNSEIDTVHDHLREYLEKFPNIRILENEHVETHGVTLIGSTLWSNFDNGNPLSIWDAQQRMNDYKCIRVKRVGYKKLHPHTTFSKNRAAIQYIQTVLANAEEKQPVVVMTHHAPSFQSVRADYIGDKLNGAYASDLEYIMLDNPEIKAWVHGHIHTRKDYMIGDCRVMVNARGYPGERLVAGEYDPYTVQPFRLEN